MNGHFPDGRRSASSAASAPYPLAASGPYPSATLPPAAATVPASDDPGGPFPGGDAALDIQAPGPAAALPAGPAPDVLTWDPLGADLAGLDGGELAALVNDALIEQARRHGWEF